MFTLCVYVKKIILNLSPPTQFFVFLPGQSSFDTELSLQLLHTALSVESDLSPHWVLDCSPFPLLYVLSQLHNQILRFV